MAHKKKNLAEEDTLGAIDVLVSRQRKFKIQAALVKKISMKILTLLNLEGWGLCIKFVGKEEIADLNYEYRSKDYPTDVLSFPQMEWEEVLRVGSSKKKHVQGFGMNVLGDIVICLDVALENAEKIGQGLDREVCFLLVHGILHLCGHDHEIEDEEKIMLDDQRKIMEVLGGDLPVWKDCVRV